ncbi:MAG: hypothetical protein ACOCYE_08260 [Pseudomonadota bacterium]
MRISLSRSLSLPLLVTLALGLAACDTTGTGDTAPAATNAAQPAPRGAANRPPSMRQMTPAEQAEMQEILQIALPQIEQCIAPFAEAARARNIEQVDFLLEFEPDGTPRGMGLRDPQRLEDDADYRAAIEVLVEGMQACPPLQDMPADSYELWEYLPISYSAQPA